MFLHLSVILFTGGGWDVRAGEMTTEAGGMHPTGMHSCYIFVLFGKYLLYLFL